jgi:hypothetical protein
MHAVLNARARYVHVMRSLNPVVSLNHAHLEQLKGVEAKAVIGIWRNEDTTAQVKSRLDKVHEEAENIGAIERAEQKAKLDQDRREQFAREEHKSLAQIQADVAQADEGIQAQQKSINVVRSEIHSLKTKQQRMLNQLDRLAKQDEDIGKKYADLNTDELRIVLDRYTVAFITEKKIADRLQAADDSAKKQVQSREYIEKLVAEQRNEYGQMQASLSKSQVRAGKLRQYKQTINAQLVVIKQLEQVVDRVSRSQDGKNAKNLDKMMDESAEFLRQEFESKLKGASNQIDQLRMDIALTENKNPGDPRVLADQRSFMQQELNCTAREGALNGAATRELRAQLRVLEKFMAREEKMDATAKLMGNPGDEIDVESTLVWAQMYAQDALEAEEARHAQLHGTLYGVQLGDTAVALPHGKVTSDLCEDNKMMNEYQALRVRQADMEQEMRVMIKSNAEQAVSLKLRLLAHELHALGGTNEL